MLTLLKFEDFLSLPSGLPERKEWADLFSQNEVALKLVLVWMNVNEGNFENVRTWPQWMNSPKEFLVFYWK